MGLQTPRRFVQERVRCVDVVTPFAVDLLLYTRRTMELLRHSVTFQELSFAVYPASIFFSLHLVDTWDVSASGPRLLLRSLTPSTELKESHSICFYYQR